MKSAWNQPGFLSATGVRHRGIAGGGSGLAGDGLRSHDAQQRKPTHRTSFAESVHFHRRLLRHPFEEESLTQQNRSIRSTGQDIWHGLTAVARECGEMPYIAVPESTSQDSAGYSGSGFGRAMVGSRRTAEIMHPMRSNRLVFLVSALISIVIKNQSVRRRVELQRQQYSLEAITVNYLTVRRSGNQTEQRKKSRRMTFSLMQTSSRVPKTQK